MFNTFNTISIKIVGVLKFKTTYRRNGVYFLTFFFKISDHMTTCMVYAHIKFLFGVSSSSSSDARVGHVPYSLKFAKNHFFGFRDPKMDISD